MDFGNSILSQTTEKTFMRGIGDWLEALMDKSGGDGWGYKRESLAANFASSWVPNIIKQPVRQVQPNFRDGGSGMRERILRQIAPWTGEESYDVYGKPETKQGVALTRLLIPAKTGAAPEMNRIDRALTNFNQANPDEAWWPAPVRRTVHWNGEYREMTTEQFARYEKLAGEYAWNLVRAVPISTSNPTLREVQRVQRAFTEARKKAKEQVMAGVR